MSILETMNDIKVAYTVGRFQPPTLGHVRMIDAMLAKAPGVPAYVFISSAKDSLIKSKMKKEYLEKMLTRDGKFPENLTLIDTATCPTPCGGPLGGWGYIKDNLGITGSKVLLVVGSDQEQKFDPKTAGMWEKIPPAERPSIYAIPRAGEGAATYSSTKAREAVASSGADGLRPFLMGDGNDIKEEDLKKMTNALLAVQDKWPKKKTGGGEEDISAFDEDMEGGKKPKRKSRNMRPKRNRKTKRRL